ncbi:MAG: AI-2E family transporter [Patescibacteria group bacterium]|nr:AI-2E family transporter [Patescibacteria group bacterium]
MTIEISHKTILFTLGIVVSGFLFFYIRDIFYLLFISFILTTALRPFVEWLTHYRVPRVFAILIIYFFIIGIIGLFLGSFIPQVIFQANQLIQKLPDVASTVLPNLNLDQNILNMQLGPVTRNVFQFGVRIFNNILTFVTIFVFTFYFLLARNRLEQTLTRFFSEEQTHEIVEVIKKIEEKLGAWARGQLLLMIIIGVATYIGLSLLHVDYALPLAVFAGFLEMVPVVGPIISAIPAILIALTVSPFLGLSVAALYFIIQQLENNIIVPQVMKRSVGLSPVVIILSFMIGARFEGIIGAILAVPTVVTIQVIIGHFLDKREKY